MIGRRSPASSSFVLAAARLRALQQDPSAHGSTTPAATRMIQKISQPGHNCGHRARRLHPLDIMALMGAAERARPGKVDVPG